MTPLPEECAKRPLHPRWDASRKLDSLEKILLVLLFPIAVALYPAAWVWARLKRWRML